MHEYIVTVLIVKFEMPFAEFHIFMRIILEPQGAPPMKKPSKFSLEVRKMYFSV